MRNIYLISLTLILSLALLGCTSTNNKENTNESDTNNTKEEVTENNENESDSSDLVEEEDKSNIAIHTGSTETLNREIEGMNEEIEVVNYEIAAYDISYQLDETFGQPKVMDNQIIYSTQNDNYKIMLEIMEETSLENAVMNLQEGYEPEAYEDKDELASTPPDENDLKGEMQQFFYPMEGFYVYEIGEHVLVITYEYPAEGSDGMNPLLESFRKSINLQ